MNYTKNECQRAAFVDRDGVINREVDHVHRIEDFHLLDGAVAGLRTLAECGYALVVVTNQAGIAKGLYGESDYAGLTEYMLSKLLEQGVRLAGVYHCPHHPQGTVARYAKICDCRKPAPGMLLRAAEDLHIDLSQSAVIGDKVTDATAGRAAGVRHTVLVESGHTLPPDAGGSADYVCGGLIDAARWLCRASRDTRCASIGTSV